MAKPATGHFAVTVGNATRGSAVGIGDRRRANLAKAEAMTDADAQSQMRDVAVRYLLLAQQFEDDSD